MGQTPIYSIPYPELTDPADVPTDMRETNTVIESVLSTFQTGMDTALDDMQDQITGATGSLAKLGEVSLAAPAALIEFTAIPQTYTHLALLATLRSTLLGGDAAALRMNADASTAYAYQRLTAVNTAISGSSLGETKIWLTEVANGGQEAPYFGSVFTTLFNYANVGQRKTLLNLGGAVAWGATKLEYVGGTWLGTAAVNRLTLNLLFGGNFAIGSKATLYGWK